MPDLCPKCGANLDMVGKSHRCIPKFDHAIESAEVVVASSNTKGVKVRIPIPEPGSSTVERRTLTPKVEGSSPSPAASKKTREGYNAFMREYMKAYRKRKKQEK